MSAENHMYHTPDLEGAQKIDALRDKFIELDNFIDSLFERAIGSLPFETVRHKALAKTHLEDARMRAIWGLARLHSTNASKDQNS